MKLNQIFKPNNLGNVVALIVAYILFFITFFLSFRYIRLNLVLFLIAFGLVFIFILLFGIISLEGIIENNKKLRMIGLSVLTIISILLITISVYVFRINSSINNIIVLPNQSSELAIAFVSYDSNEYQDSDDMKEAKIGILSNSEDSDRNSFVRDEIQSLGLNVSYVEFLSYNDLILSLFEKKIDIAALPNDYYNQFSDYEGYLEYLDKTKIIYEFKTTIENSNEQVDLDVTKEPFSILIMGNDGGRTDSLILATYNPLKLAVTMTSVPRDSYVPIACYPEQQKDKIGHAFSVSRDCAIQTVENLFDLDINYFVEVNFKGVVEIVDALDRIWIDSPVEFVGQNSDEERGHYTVKIFKGGQWVTGEQALTFARERYSMPGGDYQRQENQQQVIQAIIDRTLQLKDVNKAINVLNAAGNNVKTNMTLNQMVEIFNVLISAINKTTLETSYMLDIMGSRVIGYSSYTYNETLQLPLWISKPFDGSIKDLKRLMLSNLEISELPSAVVTQFDARLVFYEENFFEKTYDEKQVHERLPDFMPSISNNNWTLLEAKEWASVRGIKLVIEEIKAGNAAYNADVVHNYIVGQSVKYGVKTSNFTSLNIKVIKHVLDCKLEGNKEYDECKYKLPDWQDYGAEMYTISSAISWFTDLNLQPTFKYIKILSTDPTYVKEKIGYVIKQNPLTWDDVRTLTEITFTIMDPNYLVLIPTTSSGWSETVAKEWVKSNLELETNYQIEYTPTIDPTQYGKLISALPTLEIKPNHISYQDILKLKFYAEGFKLKDYKDKSKTLFLQADCDARLFQCTFTNVVATATDTVGNIKSQSIPFDTLKTKAEWAITVINFEVFVSSGS